MPLTTRRCRLSLALPIASVALVAGAALADDVPLPAVLDPALEIELFAREPEIVTPIALDVDDRGRVWVVESHTHFRPRDYDGPPSDRVLVFAPRDGQGPARPPAVFAEGFTHLMAIELLDDGTLLAATRREVYRLEDADGDGRADRRQSLARLETRGDYPHNGLSGFALDGLGNVFFALGENLGVPYGLAGSDGAALSGGGEGGNIYRMRLDGGGLVRWATGFWNTFHLELDPWGNLFAVDNDPDSRPPCRLLHIVRGGDYGFRFRLGRRGLHPFQSWDGELPGTLPMAAGTGEGPSGIALWDHPGAPARWRGGLLVTSWGDYRLEIHHPVPRGSSFATRSEVLVRGGETFRPVGIAIAPDGSVYFSDWVDKEYHLHGKGRIWRLCVRDDAGGGGGGGAGSDGVAGTGRGPSAEDAVRARALVERVRCGQLDWGTVEASLAAGLHPELEAAAVRLLGETGQLTTARLGELATGASPRVLLEGLAGLAAGEAVPLAVIRDVAGRRDLFLDGALVAALERSGARFDPSPLLGAEEPRLRLLGLLALARLGRTAFVARFLEDPDPAVRRAAVQWVGEAGLGGHRVAVEEVLQRGALTRELLDAALATLDLLDGGDPRARDERTADEHLLALAVDASQPARLRTLALRAVSPDFEKLRPTVLERLLAEEDEGLRVEAVRSLRERDEPRVAPMLLELARDRNETPALRREAIAGLARFAGERRNELVALLDDPDASVRRVAARSLGEVELSAAAASRRDAVLGPTLGAREGADAASVRRELLARAGAGDATAGELLFFHPAAPACARCHSYGGRGGAVGPDLSTIGRRPLEHLVDSLLAPAKDIAPQYATWLVVTRKGPIAGILLAEDGESLELGTADGTVIRVPTSEIVSRQLEETSIMPADLLATMTLEDAADLAAFLARAR